jgi:LacI family transcriptional regulator
MAGGLNDPMLEDADPQDRHGRVTLHDVAAAAGVSKSTVSRILDERLPRSEGETAKRVRKIAVELGYVRDVSAASLRRGKTLTIGAIVPRLTDTVMAMLYESLARACARSGRFAIVATTEDEPQADRAAAQTLLQRGVDGLVISTARIGDDFPEELSARGVPFVLALRTDGRSLSSVSDDILGGYLATRHLIDLGHRRIGLIAGPPYASSSRGRVEGFGRAMAEAGLAVDPALIVESSFGIDSGAEATDALMRLSPPPTAIFAVNDNTAIGALSMLTRLGLSVPEDVSLVGYNDIPIVSRLPTPLTSVRVPFDQIASAALDLLAQGPADGADRIRIATPTLIPRRSTAAPSPRSRDGGIKRDG